MITVADNYASDLGSIPGQVFNFFAIFFEFV